MGFGFLAPLLFGFAALSIPIFLLYMLRLRRTEIPISSTFLWQQLVRDQEANAPWQRLRPNLLMFLQLLILAALVLALARPYQEVETFTTGRTVILLDASASMNTADMDDGQTRFEIAQEKALDNVDLLDSDDTMSIIRVSGVPEVLAADSRDKSVLRDAIEDAGPGEAPANWEAALALAAAGGEGVDDLRVVILSDGGLPANLPEIPGDLVYSQIGEESDNLAITALSPRALPNQVPQLFAQVTNFGDETSEFIFALYLDDEDDLFNAQRHRVDAGNAINILIEELPRDFNWLKAEIIQPSDASVPDYLDTDDVAYAVFDEGSTGQVLLVTEQNRFVEQTFGNLPGVELTVSNPDQGPPSGDYDLYIFDNWLPEGQMPRADILFINPPESTTFFDVTGTSTETAIDPETGGVLSNDPRTQYLDFSDVFIREFKTLERTEWATPLVVTENDAPLVLAGEQEGQQIGIITFALQSSDLPLKLSWPILVVDLMEWYRPAQIINVSDSLTPGNALTIRPSVDADEVRVHLPDDETRTFGFENSPQVVFGETSQIGLYEVEVLNDGHAVQRDYFTVNLFSALESNISPTDEILVQTGEGTRAISSGTQEELGRREIWEWVAIIGLIIIGLEWIYYQYTLRRKPRLASTRISSKQSETATGNRRPKLGPRPQQTRQG
jgi:hypothetical protein